MSLIEALALLGIAAILCLFVVSVVWVWRDMGQRSRPPWLRVLVLVTFNMLTVGFVIYLVDLRRHPHDPSLTVGDWLLQRYRKSGSEVRA
ncbi:MAG TPA: hypothetical protein VGA36_04980 [Nitriliruptorales bacterium]